VPRTKQLPDAARAADIVRFAKFLTGPQRQRHGERRYRQHTRRLGHGRRVEILSPRKHHFFARFGR